MTRVAAIVQARMGSTRLPGKVLADIDGRPLLARVLDRIRGARRVDEVVVATSAGVADDPIAELCSREGWACFRGSEEDVLDRYHGAAVAHGADHVVRVTADCPFVSPVEIDRVVARHLEAEADYTHSLTIWGSGMPLGTGVEVFTLGCLERSWREGLEPHHREHVDEYVGDHPELFHVERVDAPPELRRPSYRLTVDEPADLELAQALYGRLGGAFELVDVVRLLDADPALAALNAHVRQTSLQH